MLTQHRRPLSSVVRVRVLSECSSSIDRIVSGFTGFLSFHVLNSIPIGHTLGLLFPSSRSSINEIVYMRNIELLTDWLEP